MANTGQTHDQQLADLLRTRQRLLEQVEISQRTIEQTRELIKQIDAMLARSGIKPEP